MVSNMKTVSSESNIFRVVVMICLLSSVKSVAGSLNDSTEIDTRQRYSTKYRVEWELFRPAFISTGNTKYQISAVVGEPYLGSSQRRSYIIDMGYFYANVIIRDGTVLVKVIPQGFYNAGGYLNAADTIHVSLANAISPYAIIASSDVILDSLTFTATAIMENVANDNYYLIIKHRSSVETWSASSISFKTGSTVSYDFTTSAKQAYGSNEIEVANGVYAIYSGDCNQDGYVDPLDLALLDQAVYNYAAGLYLSTDVNGDKYVDPLDMSIVDQNSYNYVGIQKPSSLKVLSAKERAKIGSFHQERGAKRAIK